MAAAASAIADALIRWYDAHARTLPWRAPPGAPSADPYRVWLSEVMLQQTTVAAVRPYFDRFTTRWPTVGDLAAAPDGELMAAWAGLGYYARARNLLACARAVAGAHGGCFPGTEAGLRALPGIGRYTAAAIAAIAFGRRAVVVDGNVERVVARLHAVERPLPAARPLLYDLADALTPDARPGDHAQAIMDLGATICTPRNPACGICPLMALCAGRATGNPARYPVKAPKAARPHRRGTAFWVADGANVMLVRRPPRGLLGGLLALPTGAWGVDDLGVEGAPFAADWRAIGAVAHVFTHFSLDLAVVAADRPAGFDPDGAVWWPVAGLERAGLPTLFARAAALGASLTEDA